jgi:hypothetical protein
LAAALNWNNAQITASAFGVQTENILKVIVNWDGHFREVHTNYDLLHNSSATDELNFTADKENDSESILSTDPNFYTLQSPVRYIEHKEHETESLEDEKSSVIRHINLY